MILYYYNIYIMGVILVQQANIYFHLQTSKKSKSVKKFVVDVAAPVENDVFDQESYVKYLVEHVKVDGIVGNLGNDISITAESDNKVVVVVSGNGSFSGKYLKYLTKKYLKKNQIRDWIRFVSVKQNQYKLQFYAVAEDDEEEEDEE